VQGRGVIFFGDNISSLNQINSVCEDLKAANRSSPVTAPLLLMTDQEGGQYAGCRRPDHVGEADRPVVQPGVGRLRRGRRGRAAPRERRMNVNLAPVLDVYRTAGDFEDQYGGPTVRTPPSAGSSKRVHRGAAGVQGGGGRQAFPGLGSATASQNTDSRP